MQNLFPYRRSIDGKAKSNTDSIEGKFDAIESEIKKIHSYDTFVLTALPVIESSAGVTDWVAESVHEER